MMLTIIKNKKQNFIHIINIINHNLYILWKEMIDQCHSIRLISRLKKILYNCLIKIKYVRNINTLKYYIYIL